MKLLIFLTAIMAGAVVYLTSSHKLSATLFGGIIACFGLLILFMGGLAMNICAFGIFLIGAFIVFNENRGKS